MSQFIKEKKYPDGGLTSTYCHFFRLTFTNIGPDFIYMKINSEREEKNYDSQQSEFQIALLWLYGIQARIFQPGQILLNILSKDPSHGWEFWNPDTVFLWKHLKH